jgi:hypothetical protein
VRRTFAAQPMEDFLGLITLAFIFIFPFALGFVTVLFLPRHYKTSWIHALFLPWLAGLGVVAVIMILAWEAWICVLMAAPIFFPLISLGGMAMCAIARHNDSDLPHMSLLFLLAAPYLVGVVENQLPSPDSIRTVQTQIVINAPAEAVWAQITSVPTIQPAEHRPAFFHLAGVPKPMQAMLPVAPSAAPENVIGMLRHSAYEGGLYFVEEITAWQPNHSYHFTIDLDPRTTPPWPWNQIGGPAFELIDGAYTLEPISADQVILHLQSRHRLTSKINAYGGLWTDFLLGDIQGYILRVVKNRAEG